MTTSMINVYEKTPLNDLLSKPLLIQAQWTSFEDLWSQTGFDTAMRLRKEEPRRTGKIASKAVVHEWYKRYCKKESPYICGKQMYLHQATSTTPFSKIEPEFNEIGLQTLTAIDLLAFLACYGEYIYRSLKQGAPLVVTRKSKRNLVLVLTADDYGLQFANACMDGGGWNPGSLFLAGIP